MRTPALPVDGFGNWSVNPTYTAARGNPGALLPDFGIVPNAVVGGSNPVANAFYNPKMAYYNELAIAFPSLYLNQAGAPANVPGFINGLINPTGNRP